MKMNSTGSNNGDDNPAAGAEGLTEDESSNQTTPSQDSRSNKHRSSRHNEMNSDLRSNKQSSSSSSIPYTSLSQQEHDTSSPSSGSEEHNILENNKQEGVVNTRASGAAAGMEQSTAAAAASAPSVENSDDGVKFEAMSTVDEEENEVLMIPSGGRTAGMQWHHRLYDKIQATRQLAGNLVNRDDVQYVIVVLIAINALMMGIATYPFVRENPTMNYAFELVDRIFLIIFTIELGFQFIYVGWRLLLDGWLVFDLVIIITSWSFDGVQIVRAFRIFRALRLITRIKVMKNLVIALFSVMPRMFAIALLLMLVSYIFAVMFTQLFKDLWANGYTDQDYFGRLDESLFTLFQIMTLDGWSDICRQVTVASGWAWFPFVIYVVISGFVVVNLVIAVVCDAISALNEEEKAKLHGGAGAADDDDDDDDCSSAFSSVDAEEAMLHQLNMLESHVERLTRTQDEILKTMDLLAATLLNEEQQQQEQLQS